MRLFSQIVAFVLLALWMPATQHCGLEAAGLITAHAEHTGKVVCCENSMPCTHDGCEVVEKITYKSSTDTLQVPAPDFVACACFLCAQLVIRDLGTALSAPVVAVDRPLGWVPTWHFARRAAPLSRAPSYLV